MPQLGETVTEGTITRWMKSVGEQVTRDEPLFEVSTDKVDSEVPAPTAGVLAEILVPEGETVAVGARLAVITDGDAAAPPAAATEPAATEPAATEPIAAPAPEVAATAAEGVAAGVTVAEPAVGPEPTPTPAGGASAAVTESPAAADGGNGAVPAGGGTTSPPASPAEAPPAAAPAQQAPPQTAAPSAPPPPPTSPPPPPPTAPPPPPPTASPATTPAARPPSTAAAPGGAAAAQPAAGPQAGQAADLAASVAEPETPPPPPVGYVARGTEAAAQAASQAPPPASAGATGILLSPVVRRLLDEHGISPSEVTGTGLGGRITREDVLALIDARRGKAGAPSRPSGAQAQGAAAATTPAPSTSPAPGPSTPAPEPAAPAAPQPGRQAPSAATGAPREATTAATAAASAATAPSAPSAATSAPAGEQGAARAAPDRAQASVAAQPSVAVMRPATDRVVPFSNIRRRTAEHMVRSKATSPHAYIAYEADFENVERVRHAWGERFRSEEGFSLTYLPFIARATVEALRDFPNLNATVVDDSLVVHQQVNLGVAVDLSNEGLIVPVVHRAEEVTLRGVARRIRDLAERARSRQLSADDIAGGTFSITNDGPFGTYFTVPIINQPQVAILATDGIRRRPVVVELPDGTESIGIHSVGTIGLSWDHRAVDGAYVSSFLRQVARILASRDWLSEL